MLHAATNVSCSNECCMQQHAIVCIMLDVAQIMAVFDNIYHDDDYRADNNKEVDYNVDCGNCLSYPRET